MRRTRPLSEVIEEANETLHCENCHALIETEPLDVYGDGFTLVCSERCGIELRQRDRDLDG